ncbi:hypothetical protein TWF481_003966 [Arthrobotrys musiformis]|uniref:Uncharacterized protein n=1 Tax=Arthrobotrys musiformis TaxID=47236 RepID=A0AAV9WJ33_9PEZI
MRFQSLFFLIFAIIAAAAPICLPVPTPGAPQLTEFVTERLQRLSTRIKALQGRDLHVLNGQMLRVCRDLNEKLEDHIAMAHIFCPQFSDTLKTFDETIFSQVNNIVKEVLGDLGIQITKRAKVHGIVEGDIIAIPSGGVEVDVIEGGVVSVPAVGVEVHV